MDFLRNCALSIICASLICGIFTGLLGKSRTAGSVRLVCGCVLLITLLSNMKPLLRISVPELMEQNILEAREQALYGKQQAEADLQAIIKDSCEAYILDKAAELNASVTVEVELSGAELPVPHGAVIAGTVSADTKAKLSRVLAEDLGIAEEDQLWIG